MTAVTLNTVIPSTDSAATKASAAVWVGRVLSGLCIAFLAVDAVMKLALVAPVVEASAKLGIDPQTAFALGVVLALCTALHVIPKTRVLGAVLVTTYLGGAVATHVLTHTPFWFPIAMGVVLWAGLALRDARVRRLS